ncbi:uncharacterized protein BKA55DRAFT_353660 [Fusarium redolens]|uniref:Uncharacterized protein n=1 Tax=Fusarium redolens TaxID=48865 RepID=A0A9P9HAQ2_FUSRE|nr:uncharacterized protein BKA55DRAFT_353660 [Fusarium redolens]KAH7254103.1 hypothetical protein BKA55DRAFT_353660 [Fusarium redolens]
MPVCSPICLLLSEQAFRIIFTPVSILLPYFLSYHSPAYPHSQKDISLPDRCRSIYQEKQKIKNSGTGNRTLGSAELIPQVLRARNVSHYTIPDADLLKSRLPIGRQQHGGAGWVVTTRFRLCWQLAVVSLLDSNATCSDRSSQAALHEDMGQSQIGDIYKLLILIPVQERIRIIIQEGMRKEIQDEFHVE